MSMLRSFRTPLKRVVDLVGAGTGLVVLAPVIGALWLIVRLKLGSPVLFRQQRPGKYGKIFEIYKFRSMLEADPAQGVVADEQRMTNFGRRLRATSLDELPTLVNVLKGDMSLVGPRPLRVEYLSLYTPRQARRHEVRPGITGLAQVSGRNALTWEDRFELDVEYVERHDLALDLQIVTRTISRVVSKSGIEGEGTSTMARFVGAAPDGVPTEHVMSHRWSGLWEAWEHDPRSIKLGSGLAAQDANARSWVYLDDHHTPVAISGLAGLDGSHLEASIFLSPTHQNDDVLQPLLQRVIQHGRSLNAEHLTLKTPGRHAALHHHAAELGFGSLERSGHTANGAQLSASTYVLSLASETKV